MNLLSSLRFRTAALVVLTTTAILGLIFGVWREHVLSESAAATSHGAQIELREHLTKTIQHGHSLEASDYQFAGQGWTAGAEYVLEFNEAAPNGVFVDEHGDAVVPPGPVLSGKGQIISKARQGNPAPCGFSDFGQDWQGGIRCPQGWVSVIDMLPIDDTHQVFVQQVYRDELGAQYMHSFDVALPLAVGGVLVSGVLAWFGAGYVQRPVLRATLATRAIVGGDRSRRLAVTGRDAFGRLSRDVNAMVDQLESRVTELERSESRQRALVADVAHELRTPTTALLATATALENPDTRDEAVELVVPQLRRLAGLTDDLLDLALLDSQGADALRRDRVNLGTLVTDVADGRALVSVTGDVTADVDPKRIAITVRNLIDNACRYGAQPVQCAVDGEGDDVVVMVTDAGEGVPAAARERIFDRFVRGDATRSTPGSGLGLALARQNARLHGGDLTLDDDGVTFRLRLAREQL